MFYRITNIKTLSTIRKYRFIGNVVRGLNCRPQNQILTAWCNNKRQVGRPITTNRSSTVKHFKIILPDEMGNNDTEDLKRWFDISVDKILWDHRMATLKNPNLDIPESQSQNPRNNNKNRSNHHSPPLIPTM